MKEVASLPSGHLCYTWKMKKLLPFLALLAACSGIPVRPDPTPTGQTLVHLCEEIKNQFGQVDWSYCVDRLPSVKNKDILYAFHGFLDNSGQYQETYFKDEIPQTKELLRLWGDDLPTIISISFGRSWMLTYNDPKRFKQPVLARTEYVAENIIPEIEKRLGITNPIRRGMGTSLGGHNLASLCFTYGKKLFASCAFINPLFPKPTCEPFSLIDFDCFSPKLVGGVSWIIQFNYRDQAHWDMDGIYGLIAKADPNNLPKIQIQIDQDDMFGFELGCKQARGMFANKNINVEYIENPNNHFGFNSQRLIDFMKN